MEFGLLGPLLVRRDADVILIPAARQRVLLAVLLFRANQVVPVDELAEMLWGAEWPATARVTVRNYVKRLRQALGDEDRSMIATVGDGYQISVAAGELDLTRFEALRGQASGCTRAGRWAEASAALHAALALWRGQPLTGVPSDVLARREGPRLAEMRLQAVEDRIEADLHLGRHGELLAGLRQLIASEPLRERLHELLMLALYRAGRQADALAAYRQARAVLVDELGIEPGPGLRDLHQRMLAGDPALAPPAPAGPAAMAGPSPVPRQLPARVRHFAGRAVEVEQLRALAEETSNAVGTVVISAIGGTAGVGKTALAVHWAHRVAGRFPDGQLYANLRGFDPSGPPAAPGEALRGFLAALGVAAERIPPGLDAQAGLYRSLLAGKKMLIVADNARDEAQVRPLLPASAGCLVLVTSRRALSGLIAAEGAHAITLDVLTEADAAGLLAGRLGADRVAAEPGATSELIGLCARLPLALAVTAARALARPGITLAALAGELRGEQNRLTALDAGDPATSVRAAFSWSYRQLTGPTARMFRLLGLAPGTDITPHAAARLAGLPEREARGLLAELAQAHLLAQQAAGRYTLHDLLRAYAAELARARDSEQERGRALTGLFDFYLAATAAAMDALVPAERDSRPRVPRPGAPVPPMGTPAAAREWLDAERATLVAVTAHTAVGWPAHATRLAAILFRYLSNGGHYADAQAIHTHALHAARRAGDRAFEAVALRNLAGAHLWLGRYAEAADISRQALALCRELGDKRSQAAALNNLGNIFSRQGRYDDAASHYRQALAACRALGDRLSQGLATGNLGLILCLQGRYRQAARVHRESLAIFREFGYREGEAGALGNLGDALRREGRDEQAAGYLRQALGLSRELGCRHYEAYALGSLGRILRTQGHYQQATEYHRQALYLYHGTGEPMGEAEALDGLGASLLAAGQPDEALAKHRQALTLASQIGHRYEQAAAHEGLAATYHATGHPRQARHHWQQALTLYTDLGVPEADQVRGRLDGLGLPRAKKTPSSQS